ncbi:MAG: heavy-metal-associated domain-containing protein [Bacteroidales bacterium]|nr:heavy-metal-associated domain-containing protein [Bacteroidales bacterium]
MGFLDIFKKKQLLDGKHTFYVEGMSCNHCKMTIERAVSMLDNISFVQANVENKTLTVEGSIDVDKIKRAVESAGFVFKGLKQ